MAKVTPNALPGLVRSEVVIALALFLLLTPVFWQR